MIMGINIGVLLAITVPPIIYAWIIYLTSPYKSINFFKGLQNLGIGVSSILLLSFIRLLIPSWHDHPDIFYNTFFYIAPREELVKLISFLLLGRLYNMNKNQEPWVKEVKKEHPIGTMFYMSMVGLGFAMFENVQYYTMYGIEVLGIRTVTSTVAHMLFGLFMGYWLAKSEINQKLGNRSVFSLIMNRKPGLRKIIYTLLGFISAVGYHGLWNYNLYSASEAYLTRFGYYRDVSGNSIMIMLLFFGLLGAKVAHKDICDSYRRSLE